VFCVVIGGGLDCRITAKKEIQWQLGRGHHCFSAPALGGWPPVALFCERVILPDFFRVYRTFALAAPPPRR